MGRDQDALTIIHELRLSAEHRDQMLAHIQACLPLESCGLLAGRGCVVEHVIPVTNAAQSTYRFRMDPVGQLRAFHEIESRGLELLAIFHSHPAEGKHATSALDVPSETDIREAAYPAIQVIWSQRSGLWSARGYWIEHGKVREVPLVVFAAE